MSIYPQFNNIHIYTSSSRLRTYLQTANTRGPWAWGPCTGRPATPPLRLQPQPRAARRCASCFVCMYIFIYLYVHTPQTCPHVYAGADLNSRCPRWTNAPPTKEVVCVCGPSTTSSPSRTVTPWACCLVYIYICVYMYIIQSHHQCVRTFMYRHRSVCTPRYSVCQFIISYDRIYLCTCVFLFYVYRNTHAHTCSHCNAA